jgi:hypothetical protein
VSSPIATRRAEAAENLSSRSNLISALRPSNYAAQLATEGDPDKWDAARREFWRLYYGPLCVVEDKSVAQAMMAVGDLLPEADFPRPDTVPITDEAYRNASIKLARTVRTLIQDAWGVHLGSLEEQ